jgi:mono/diheme cytochrome c family protein
MSGEVGVGLPFSIFGINIKSPSMLNRTLVAALAACLLFASCTPTSVNVLNASNLKSSFYTVRVNADTVLHTEKGALIKIPAGALQGGGDAVKLEIKEANTAADMALAALTTKAGGNLLSSGGMIYIAPADNGNITLAKPISINMPTKMQRKGMQLYKGQKKQDGTIDWTDPQQLPEQQLSAHLQNGEKLYRTNCSACHKIDNDAAGPQLAFMGRKFKPEWLIPYVHNSAKMINEGDVYANCIYQRWNMVSMTAFPTLTDEDILAIRDYVDYQSQNLDSNEALRFNKIFDSCQVYNNLKSALQAKKQTLQGRLEQLGTNRSNLVSSNGAQVKRMETQPVAPMQAGSATAPATNWDTARQFVEPTQQNAEYYQFTITTFGWYNIDILLKNLPGYENSTLTVRMVGTYAFSMDVFLLLPEQKILLHGGKVAGSSDTYAFFTTDGKIPLPQSAQAYVIATGEAKGQLYYGRISVRTTRAQALQLSLQPIAKDAMNASIDSLNLPDMTMHADESKNARTIRTIDTTVVAINSDIEKVDSDLRAVEKMKPLHFDCNCGRRDFVSETDSSSSQ